MTHTPGPWRHGPSLSPPYRCVYFSRKRDEPYCTSPLEPGDAKLIAAAPELLAACMMVLDDPGLTANANDVIRAAIESATK